MTTIVGERKQDIEGTPKWPSCGDPKTPENTVIVGGRFEYCRKCQNAKAMERHYRRNPGARRRYFASLDEAIQHFTKRDGLHQHWSGPKAERVFAVITHHGKLIYVARYLWEQKNGPTKPQHTLYSTCEFQDCVSPECREERRRTVVCEAKVLAERTRSAFNTAAIAATRREGPHLFAIDAKATVQVMGREMDLRNLLWTRAGNRRHYGKPLIATCEFSHCLEPAHQREGVADVLARLQHQDGHLIIPDGKDLEIAKRAAWEASGKVLPAGKALVTLCGRSDCAEPCHQTPWAFNKTIPPAVRSAFWRVLLRKRETQRGPAPERASATDDEIRNDDIEAAVADEGDLAASD
jgi:hypothetical protein